jgi:hypothetical protein
MPWLSPVGHSTQLTGRRSRADWRGTQAGLPPQCATENRRALARLLTARAALVAAGGVLAPERWRLLYAPKLEIHDNDILPRFPPELRRAASGRSTPALPPIE